MSRVAVIAVCALLGLFGQSGPNAFADGGSPAKPKKILIFYSSRYAVRVNERWDRGIRRVLEWRMPESVTIDSESLDFERLNAREYREPWLKLLRKKYEVSPPDVVILVHDAPAQAFAESYRNLFPNAAVVLCTVSKNMYDRLPRTPHMTGVLYRGEYQKAVEGMRQLRPATRSVVVVGGTGETDKVLLAGAQAAFAAETQIDFTYWTGLPIKTLCAQAVQLPPDSIILYLSEDRDCEGRLTTSSCDVVRRLSAAASVPVFGISEVVLGEGIVGSCFLRAEEQGMRAGEIAARILQGADPANIPISVTDTSYYVFDWRQLQRWGFGERDLPHGSQIEAREPTVWEAYWPYITAGGSVTLLQSLLIGSLLVNRRRRSRAEHALADRLRFEAMLSHLSSRFVHVAAENVPSEIEDALARITEHLALDRGIVFEVTADGRQLRAVASWVRAGQAPPSPLISLDSLPWLWEKLKENGLFHFSSLAELPADAAQEREFCSSRGLKAGVVALIPTQGETLGMLALGQFTRERSLDESVLTRLQLVCEVIANALARARTDAALSASRNEARQLAGRLLTAQEDERRRLAREMHDDISQRLATTAIEAGKVELQLSPRDGFRKAVTGLKEELIVLSDDVHRISRQLHPAILDDLGLEDAIRSECDRFAEREKLVVGFHCGRLPYKVPKDVALCMYRIVQEALRNVAKHSKTDRVELILNADLEFLNLEVRDFGRGFEPAAARAQPGLGLASMEERVRLVGGEISITSAPAQGTSIAVRIPLPEEGV